MLLGISNIFAILQRKFYIEDCLLLVIIRINKNLILSIGN